MKFDFADRFATSLEYNVAVSWDLMLGKDALLAFGLVAMSMIFSWPSLTEVIDLLRLIDSLRFLEALTYAAPLHGSLGLDFVWARQTSRQPLNVCLTIVNTA